MDPIPVSELGSIERLKLANTGLKFVQPYLNHFGKFFSPLGDWINHNWSSNSHGIIQKPDGWTPEINGEGLALETRLALLVYLGHVNKGAFVSGLGYQEIRNTSILITQKGVLVKYELEYSRRQRDAWTKTIQVARKETFSVVDDDILKEYLAVDPQNVISVLWTLKNMMKESIADRTSWLIGMGRALDNLETIQSRIQSLRS
jgi:hypothetical protein